MFRAGQAVDGILQPKAGKADQFHGDDGNRSRFPGGCGGNLSHHRITACVPFFHINIDGIIGLVVSVLVLIAGVNIAKDTLAPLLGQAIEPEVYHRISAFVESYDGIIGSHDLIVHNYGPSRSMASIHAEVPSKVDIEISHAVVDQIERDALEKLGIFLVIHMDPVETDNELAAILKKMTIDVILHLDSRLTLHDFRIVQSQARFNLIFDLVVPREYTKQMREELTRQVCERVRERDSRCACIITVENSYQQEENGSTRN